MTRRRPCRPRGPLAAALLALSLLAGSAVRLEAEAAPAPSATNAAPAVRAAATLTNTTFSTGSTWSAPRRDAGYPEVKNLFRGSEFKDVYGKDTESAARRFEIVFVISLPALLLINDLVLRSYNAARFGNFDRKFNDTQNGILFGGATVAAGLIATKDYFDTKKWKKERSLELELWRETF